MTLMELRRHKVFFITMCLIVFAISIFIVTRSNEVGAVSDGEAHLSCLQGGTWNYISRTEATCTKPGTENFLCNMCGATTTNQLPATGHKYENRSNDTEHWQFCTKCNDTTSATEHTFGQWKITKTETCTEEGEQQATCPVCNYTSTKTRPLAAHKVNFQSGGNYYHIGTCSECNETIREAHNKYISGKGDTGHRYKCSVEGCNWYIDEKHTYENGKCTVCDWSQGSSSGGGEETCEHSYELKSNETTHWQECTNCGAKVDEAEHTVAIWTNNDTLTSQTEGTHSGKCTVCDLTITKQHDFDTATNKCTANGCNAIMEHEHQWEVRKDNTNHWQICRICQMEKENSRGAHVYGTWSDNGDGTHIRICMSEGCGQKQTEAHVYEDGVCTQCGFEEKDEDLNCEHLYSIVQKDNTFHWIKCSKCGEIKPSSKEKHTYEDWINCGDGTHSSSCILVDCRHLITEEHTFENGVCTECGATEADEICEHTFTEEKNDEDYHWLECSKCGAININSREAHNYGKWEDNGDGTHIRACNYEECERTQIQQHTYEDGICIECGAKKSNNNGSEDGDDDNNNNGNNSGDNDGNNGNGDNNNNNNNNSNNGNGDKNNGEGNDNTIADKEIPKTGKIAMTGTVTVLLITGMFGLIKFIKYRNI